MITDRQGLMRVARRLMSSRADAEDIVQDTYVRALAKFPDSLGSQPAWLYTVLRNVAIDRLRRSQFESRQLGSEMSIDGSSETPMDLRFECEAALRHMLSRVSPTEAAAILLRDVFEFDYDEIGRLCGRNEAAARQLMHRAKTRARHPERTADADEPNIALYSRAIETRDPALLMHILQVTTAQGESAEFGVVASHRGARSSSVLVQVNGRYVIALVLDGVVLCIVPVGTETRFAAEAA